MSPAHAVVVVVVEGALSGYALAALAWAAHRFRHDDLVEGVLLAVLGVIGAFALVALDAARRGTGL